MLDLTQLSERQITYLKLIMKEYIRSGDPIGSKTLIEVYNLNVSSATVRNEMNVLEHYQLLEKSHASSGRIPTTLGYQTYVDLIRQDDLDKDLKNKLKVLFSKRIYSIDQVIDEASKIITKNANFSIVTTNHATDELLKSIQLVPINAQNATIVIVTSTGRVVSKLLEVTGHIGMSDLRIAIRVFKERLLDTPLRNLVSKAESLAFILRREIHNFEFILQEFVTKIFDFHEQITSKVYGRSNIVQKNEFKSKSELLYLLDLLEKKSIWSSIENTSKNDDENLKIEIGNHDAAIISKQLETDNIKREISVIGTKRIEYEKVLSMLNYLTKLIQGDSEK